MLFVRNIRSFALLLSVFGNHAFSQQPSSPQQPPIIDMHIHATAWDHYGSPPPPNMVTGKVPAARTDKEFMDATLAELKRYNIVKAVAGGPREHVLRWLAADPGRIIGGTMMGPRFPIPDVSVLREDYRAGRLRVLGELGLIYNGVAPNDPQMEPYWKLAEELDIPVALHTGLGPPRTPYECCPKFRNSLGNPSSPRRSLDPPSEAARLLNACGLSIPAGDDSHHAHVPTGICRPRCDRLAQTAGRIPRILTSAGACRVRKAVDVRVRSDDMARGDWYGN